MADFWADSDSPEHVLLKMNQLSHPLTQRASKSARGAQACRKQHVQTDRERDNNSVNCFPLECQSGPPHLHLDTIERDVWASERPRRSKATHTCVIRVLAAAARHQSHPAVWLSSCWYAEFTVMPGGNNLIYNCDAIQASRQPAKCAGCARVCSL